MTKTRIKSSKLAFFFSGVILLGIGSYIAITKFTPTPTPTSINEVTASGTTTLTFVSPTTPVVANTSTNIPITINTTTSKVTGVNVVITYDPAKATVTAVTQGDFLTQSIASAKLTSGKVTFAYGVATGAGVGKQGTGTVATLAITPKSTSPFTLTFNTGTLVSATGMTTNVLKTANPLTITPATPINGGWSAWSTKNTACGFSGTQTRTCTNPAPQYGGATCTGATTQPYTNPACPLPGDFNADGTVDLFDYNALVAGFGTTYTIFDFNDLVANYGKTSP